MHCRAAQMHPKVKASPRSIVGRAASGSAPARIHPRVSETTRHSHRQSKAKLGMSRQRNRCASSSTFSRDTFSWTAQDQRLTSVVVAAAVHSCASQASGRNITKPRRWVYAPTQMR
eukprot:scaffold73177_cov69-Phaeocystis_antarctica.AAC.4